MGGGVSKPRASKSPGDVPVCHKGTILLRVSKEDCICKTLTWGTVALTLPVQTVSGLALQLEGVGPKAKAPGASLAQVDGTYRSQHHDSFFCSEFCSDLRMSGLSGLATWEVQIPLPEVYVLARGEVQNVGLQWAKAIREKTGHKSEKKYSAWKNDGK